MTSVQILEAQNQQLAADLATLRAELDEARLASNEKDEELKEVKSLLLKAEERLQKSEVQKEDAYKKKMSLERRRMSRFTEKEVHFLVVSELTSTRQALAQVQQEKKALLFEKEQVERWKNHHEPLLEEQTQALAQLKMELRDAREDSVRERIHSAAKLQNLEKDLVQATCSERRLQAVMTNSAATLGDFRSAIASVEAVLDEARRELDRKLLSKQRAAYEGLHWAMEKAEQELLAKAIEVAEEVELCAEDLVQPKSKLLELQQMSPEEHAAREERNRLTEIKKQAFQMVKQNNVESLAAVLDSEANWKEWRDHQGRSLEEFARFLKSSTLPRLLQATAGSKNEIKEEVVKEEKEDEEEKIEQISTEEEIKVLPHPEEKEDEEEKIEQISTEEEIKVLPHPEEKEEDIKKMSFSAAEEAALKTKAFKAAMQEDERSLAEVLNAVHKDIWQTWKNGADQDLLTLCEARGKKKSTRQLENAKGVEVKQQPRRAFVDRENVWILLSGDVQPRQATVLEDAPPEADEIWVEFWSGPEGSQCIPRCQICV